MIFCNAHIQTIDILETLSASNCNSKLFLLYSQPLLVALRRRCSLKSSLPTIYEYTEGQPYCYRMESSIEEPSHYEDEDEEEEEDLEPWSIGEQKSSGSFTLHHCER